MSNYGLDLNKIKNNFKKYQQPEVYTGGSPNFDERTGNYITKGPGHDGRGVPTNYEPGGKYYQENKSAQQFKTDYANDLTRYMNRSGDKTNISNQSENNNFDQNAGNKEDWLTNIGNQNEIKYSNIGNDYSVNIAGIGDGFSNMQGAAAYTALNNNQHARSSSEINGLKRAAQASEQATGLVGAKDRAANLYNSLGYSQNYWRQKADAQQNFYLGDIYSQQAPEFQLPESPSDPMDGDTTQDTLKKFQDGLD